MANCDQAEEVGEKIQKSLDGVAVTSAKIKKPDHVKTLQNLQTALQWTKIIFILSLQCSLCIALRLLNDSLKT